MRNNRVSYANYSAYRRDGYRVAEHAIFENLTKIDSVIKELLKFIDKNGHTTLAEYYKIIGARVLEDDTTVGWTDLIDIQINGCRCGYELTMPPLKCLRVDPVKDAYDILQDVCEDNYEDTVQDALDCLRNAL